MAEYIVTRPVLISDAIHRKGAKVECNGAPAAGLEPLSVDAVEPSRRARQKRQLERWLALGAALMQRL